MATLTPAQLATLKADIAANPDLASQPMNSDGDFEIARLLNLDATPTFFAWRSAVPMDEIMQNGFDWTRVDNLTVGKARIWDWMRGTGTINPSQANVRAGILAVFGTAGDLSMRQSIFGHCQRPATRLEKLLAVSGNGTTVTEGGIGPATLGYEGSISYQQVAQARV